MAITSTYQTVQPPRYGFNENQLHPTAPRVLCKCRIHINGFYKWPGCQHYPPLHTPSRSICPILQRPLRNDAGGMTAQAFSDYQRFASVNDCDFEDKFSRWALQVRLADKRDWPRDAHHFQHQLTGPGFSEAPSVFHSLLGHSRSPGNPSRPGPAWEP